MMTRRRITAWLTMAVLAACGMPQAVLAQPQDRHIVMASTTSTEQSGLFAHLLAQFRQATGIDVLGGEQLFVPNANR